MDEKLKDDITFIKKMVIRNHVTLNALKPYIAGTAFDLSTQEAVNQIDLFVDQTMAQLEEWIVDGDPDDLPESLS